MADTSRPTTVVAAIGASRIGQAAIAATDVSTLQEALGSGEPVQVRRSGGELHLARPRDMSVVLGRLAREAALDLPGNNRGRLRTCGDDTCSGIFLDHTGRRRWCSDERCGVRSRVRAHRARERARTT